MNTKILEYIIAIAEEESVSRAAERFYLSHPALSGHLKKLEQQLGTPLFHRTAKGMKPTPAGLVFLADARAILHEEQKLQEALNVMRREKRQLFRVMVDQPFYNRFVQRVLPAFSSQHRDYTVDIVKCNASQAREELIRGTATLGILLTVSQQSAGLVYLPCLSTCLRLVFPPGYTGGTDIQGLRKALDGGMLLSLYPADSTLNMIVRQRLSAFQIYPKHPMEGESYTIMEHLKSARSCSVLPEPFCADAEARHFTVGDDAFSPLYHVIAYSASATLSPIIQDLMKIMIDVFSI